MRIACYGWVDRDGGSVASAGYTVLGELLRRGHRVDLFADREHVPVPAGLAGDPLLGYVGVAPPRSARLPAGARRLVEPVAGPYWRAYWRREFSRAAEDRHRRAPYDLLLTLGVAPPFTVAGVPTVAWLQSPVHTELDALRRLRPLVVDVSGRPFYTAATAYYLLRRRRDRRLLGRCDEVVCGSAWSAQALADDGFPAGRVHALPYPIDLDRFALGQPAANGGPVLLSLGRLDPRKRLDLLVAAFDLVAAAEPAARLLVVGREGTAPNQLSLLERSAFRDRIEYRRAVPQADVPALLRAADVLVQPSEYENFGSAVAEALACGVPAVVGPTNGTADYLDPTSAVFASYSAADVAGAVGTVLARRRRDPSGTARAARATAERLFSAEAVVDGLEAVLQRAAGASRPHRV